jgi:hypothetical protein
MAGTSPAMTGKIDHARERSDKASEAQQHAGEAMTHIVYKVVRHEDGWAYTVGGTFSETFPSHQAALDAARRAAAEQRAPGDTEAIEYEDEKGEWHREVASGRDRPDTEVEDTPYGVAPIERSRNPVPISPQITPLRSMRATDSRGPSFETRRLRAAPQAGCGSGTSALPLRQKNIPILLDNIPIPAILPPSCSSRGVFRRRAEDGAGCGACGPAS